MKTLLHIYSFAIILWSLCAHGRKVPARTDICNRLPQLSVCSDSPSDRDVSTVSNDDAQSSDADRIRYCNKYGPNFEYYCLGAGRGDPKAREFCPAYSAICGGVTAESARSFGRDSQAQSSDDQLLQICLQYQHTAAKYCSKPSTERGALKDNCDRYRSNCNDVLRNSQQTGALAPVQVLPRQPTPGCLKYQQLYFAKCAAQEPATQQEIAFCQTFAASCGPDDLMPGASMGREPTMSSVQNSGSAPIPDVPAVRQPPPQATVPLEPAPQQAVPAQGGSPLTFGRSTGVGNIAGVGDSTAISPLSGVSTGRNVNAGPIGVSSGSGVNFGGLPGLGSLGGGGGIPGLGGGGIPGFGRKRRSAILWVMSRFREAERKPPVSA